MGAFLLAVVPRASAHPAQCENDDSPAIRRCAGTGDRYRHSGKEILIIRERLNRLMAEHTGQPLEVIERDTERDRFMDAEQSRDYGLVDEVVQARYLKRRRNTRRII